MPDRRAQRLASQVQGGLVSARVFVGQGASKAKKSSGSGGGGGMKQAEQKAVLDEFRRGAFNTLVATCIGEEGLDIPQVSCISPRAYTRGAGGCGGSSRGGAGVGGTRGKACGSQTSSRPPEPAFVLPLLPGGPHRLHGQQRIAHAQRAAHGPHRPPQGGPRGVRAHHRQGGAQILQVRCTAAYCFHTAFRSFTFPLPTTLRPTPLRPATSLALFEQLVGPGAAGPSLSQRCCAAATG